jgi:hypothetical protein
MDIENIEMIDLTDNQTVQKNDHKQLFGPPLIRATDYPNEIHLGSDLRRYDSVQDTQGDYFWYCLDQYDYQFTEYLLPILSSINSNIGYFNSVLALDPCLTLSSFPRVWWHKKPHNFLWEIVIDLGFTVCEFLPRPTKMDCIDFFMNYPQFPGSAPLAAQLFLKKYCVSRKRLTNYFLSRFNYDQLVGVGDYFDIDLTTETCFRNALRKMQQELDTLLQSFS